MIQSQTTRNDDVRGSKSGSPKRQVLSSAFFRREGEVGDPGRSGILRRSGVAGMGGCMVSERAHPKDFRGKKRVSSSLLSVGKPRVVILGQEPQGRAFFRSTRKTRAPPMRRIAMSSSSKEHVRARICWRPGLSGLCASRLISSMRDAHRAATCMHCNHLSRSTSLSSISLHTPRMATSRTHRVCAAAQIGAGKTGMRLLTLPAPQRSAPHRSDSRWCARSCFAAL